MQYSDGLQLTEGPPTVFLVTPDPSGQQSDAEQVLFHLAISVRSK